MTDAPQLDESLAGIAHLASPLSVSSAVTPNFRVRAHQKIVSDAIVDAFFGNGPRFIAVSMPQQFGKSSISAIGASIWVQEMHALGMLPGGMVGLVTYEDSLAMSWSTKIRRTIAGNPDLFHTKLRSDSKAASYWETELEGGVLATGVGGTIVGRPITLLVLDDVIKNIDQANSERHRDMNWNLWQTVAIGRLQPWSVVVCSMTRWHEDDLIGRFLSDETEGDPSDWKYICLPALAEENDPIGREVGEPLLRPQADQTIEQARHEMARVKASVSEYTWNTMWMQHPSDPEGTIFYESKWRYYGGDSAYELPTHFDLVIMSWDMAFKDEKDSDFVVGQAWGTSGADRYLIDLIRGRWDYATTESMVKSFAHTIRSRYSNATAVLVEDKANGTAVINRLRSSVGGLIAITPKESKLARAHTCQPLLLGGNLYLPAQSTSPWVREFISEMSAFPRGTHDDQVDCATQALNYLTQFGHGGARWRSPAKSPNRIQDVASENRTSTIRGAGRVGPADRRVVPASPAATARRAPAHPLRVGARLRFKWLDE